MVAVLREELDWPCYRALWADGKRSPGLGDSIKPCPDTAGPQAGRAAVRDRDGPARWRPGKSGHPGSSGTARPRSPRSPVTGPSRTGRGARRLDAIRDDPNIALIERPEYKRRWNREPWDDQVKRALRSWLLDRLESGRYWPDPRTSRPSWPPCTPGRAAPPGTPTSSRSPPSTPAAPDFPLAKLVEELVAAESVPFLPVLRYKPSGLVKRQVWERTWDLQRREDAGEDVGPIPVPPKYTSADFLDPTSGGCGASSTCPRSGSSATRTARATATPRSSSPGPAGTTSGRRRPWPPTTSG